MKILLLVTLLAVLYTVDYSNSAAVRSEEFAEQLRRIVQEMHPDSLRTQRATESGNDDRPKRNCYDTPCGWNTYNTITRRSTTFMANTCKCPDETYKCVRTGENVSISAYVYHCRQNTTVDDIEGETDMDYLS
ncbi:PREDICTED: uncharacterized protein LOC108545740 [Eufriesea mexicana]|uniref:uncharacterized protein LOC108545740 n=1 Tax=Eufriesea mexicana TaxID=516756 RepID=UPI00083BE72A|nr:PREDICTED: uncharacterized protein LOC108545740 [Eufriesea mexicana]